LDAEKWYSITNKEIKRSGGRGLLDYYNGSYIKALTILYPELKENLLQLKEGWRALANQRTFFDGFARSKNFNPLLDAENWYSVTYKEITRAGGSGLLGYYGGSHTRALRKLYPELILIKGKFLNSKRGWKVIENQRNFFDTFAKSKKFDPCKEGNWYSIFRNDVIRAGGKRILDLYNGSHVEALLRIYPELKLQKENFLQFQGFV